jgi:hypothetical protein
MNERIKQLAEQAEKYASEKDGKYDGAGNLNWQWQDINMEKFAELIVKETMQVVANQLPSNQYLDVAHAVIEHYKDNDAT